MKKNNKGFTLVELIVVIAILGVLMAVLVPQYIQYVDKSRQATDANAISELFHAVEITAASTENLTAGTIAVSVVEGKLTYTITTSNINTGNALSSIFPSGEATIKSTAGQSFSATINVGTDKVLWANGSILTIGSSTVAGSIAPAPAGNGQ